MFGHALGLLENSQQLPLYTLDNRIYEAQGIMLVVRDYVKAIYDLYPEIAAKNNEANMKEAMVYLGIASAIMTPCTSPLPSTPGN